jgi:hypothetical protein
LEEEGLLAQFLVILYFSFFSLSTFLSFTSQ